MSAGIQMLEMLKTENPYPALETLSRQLAEGLSTIAHEFSIPHQVAQVGSMLTLFFNDRPVTSYEISRHNDTKAYARFFHAMLDHGVYLPCSQFEAWFVSIMHTPDDIEKTLITAREAMGIVARDS